jgi:formamidopyrimidine-DNA glycosylase
MPELPEVETMRRGLMPTIGGFITRIEFPVIPYRPIQMTPQAMQWHARLRGKRIVAVDRIAKRVLVRIDNGDSIVMQPKMAGLALIADPPSAEHTRLVVYIAEAQCDRFIYWDRRGLGTVHLWTAQQCEEFLGPDCLGPDALAITADDFIHRLGRIKRPVKPALLDQKLVAGVGNLYASEILHQAKVHPEQLCESLSRPQWQRIYQSMRSILLEAIENEGSTLGDGTYRNAINGEGQYQNHHRVYARDGEQCQTCESSKVVRIVQTQRSTFYCPRCQRLGKSRIK